MSVFICILMLIPGSTVLTEINDADVIKSPLFWWFFGTIAIFKISTVVSTVMEDTICVQLLGKKLFIILLLLLFNLNRSRRTGWFTLKSKSSHDIQLFLIGTHCKRVE